MLQYAHASRHPDEIGTIPMAGFVLFLGRSSLTGFANVRAFCFCSINSFILSMWCVLIKRISLSIFFRGSTMLGVMHPVIANFLFGCSFLNFLISLSIFASPFTVQMLYIIQSEFVSSAVSNCPLIISPSAMFALQP